MKQLPKWSRGAALLVFAAMLCVAVLYSRGVRQIALGEQFQYIPREAELIVASGDVESLWKAVERIVGPLLGEGSLLDEEHITVGTKGKEITSYGDLEKYGLDTHRGILVSIYRPTTAPDFVAVVPVISSDSVLDYLKPSEGSRVQQHELRDAQGRRYIVYDYSNFLLCFPQKGLAVVTSTAELMQRSVTRRDENKAAAANNDALYRAVRNVARGPLLVGPTVFAYWQSRTAPFDERAAVMRLLPDEVRIDGEIGLNGGTLRVVDDLRRRSEQAMDWIAALPDQTLGVAVLQDAHLARYQNFLFEEVLRGAFPRWAKELQGGPSGINLPQFHRIAAAVTGIQNGLPDFVIGFWGKNEELEALRARLQREYRRARDVALLKGAVATYVGQGGGPPPTLSDLERLHLLSPEEHSLFHRYPLQGGKVGEPRFADQDFANSIYERDVNGHRIRFLAPPLGRNDLQYRSDLADASPATLRGDRYRMATVVDNGVLWIASDLRDLTTMLRSDRPKRRTPSAGPLAPGPAASKLHVALDVDRTLAALLLSGMSAKDFKKDGWDKLQKFSALEVDAVPSFDESRLHFSARLRRGGER